MIACIVSSIRVVYLSSVWIFSKKITSDGSEFSLGREDEPWFILREKKEKDHEIQGSEIIFSILALRAA